MPFPPAQPIAPQDVVEALRSAARDYECAQGARQVDLKPITVRAVDGIVGVLWPGLPGLPRMWTNSMTNDPDRKWIVDNLTSTSHYEYELFVDIHLTAGAGRPFETMLTAESEGHSDHARGLARGDVEENDLRWDLEKLLALPSPFRLMTLRASPLHHDAVEEHLVELVSHYAATAVSSPLHIAVLATGRTDQRSSRLLTWAAGAWSVAPERTAFLFG